MTSLVGFIWGFGQGLSPHLARVLLWAFLVAVVAVALDVEPSLRLLGVVTAGNVIGRFVYRD